MNIRDLSELKRIWKPGNLCCDRYAACYLDGKGGMTVQPARPLLAEPEETINKHMALVKKMLSGELENQILQVAFPEPLTEGCAADVLERTRDCRLGKETLEEFFSLLADGRPQEGPYELLIYHLSYDIPEKGTDGADQGESDEVYEHVVCLLCPIKKTKANLGVALGALTLTRREEVLGAPALGFLWPAFDGRSEDRDAIVLYHADPGEVPHGFWQNIFGVGKFLTTAEIRQQMTRICQETVPDPQEADGLLAGIAEALGNLAPESSVTTGELKRILEEAQIPENLKGGLLARYDESLNRYSPKAYQLTDPEKNLKHAVGKQRKKMRELLLKAAGFIRDTSIGKMEPVQELVRQLLTAADLQGGGQ